MTINKKIKCLIWSQTLLEEVSINSQKPCKIFFGKLSFLDLEENNNINFFSFMALFTIFNVLFSKKKIKNQHSGRNKHFGEKPSATNLNYFRFFIDVSTFYLIQSKITKIYLFFSVFSKDKFAALEIDYGLNLSFGSPQ